MKDEDIDLPLFVARLREGEREALAKVVTLYLPQVLRAARASGLPKFSGEEVIIARRGDEFFAVGAHCPHYGGPLARGLLVGEEVRCPLHHASFDLRTGEVLRAPAFDPIPCWRVERIGETVFVKEKLPSPTRKPIASASAPASVVIVGGGGAGLAAADTLRREGYEGSVTMISADDFAPYDRPNLSKEYLTGQAPPEWMPLRSGTAELSKGRVMRIHMYPSPQFALFGR